MNTTIFINNDTSNPSAVGVTIDAYYDYPGGWEWSITSINSVELMIGDKEGIDITKQVLTNTRAKALITAQVADEDDQIVDALTENEDENIKTDELIEKRTNAA